uniref:Down syndrome cell adhesion molecule-like protein Dscam2 n=1 Tax=Panagrellus redivivus TaxID=6233 RepID=A0A7E4WCE2_PANRE
MDGTLYFSYNKKEDASSYACSLSLPTIQSGHYGPFFNLVLPQSLISISSAPRIDEFQPQIFPEIPTRGQAVFIECFAYGFPAPKYKWSRVDGEPLSSRHRILNYGRVLKIDAVTVDDAVRYKCVASNEHGRQSAEVQLVINSPPILLRPLIQKRIAVNTSTTFECLISNRNSGQVSIEWFHDGQPIAPLLMPASDRRRFKVHDQVLSIFNALERDSGIYQCIASNDVGSVSSSARLSVDDNAPKFHGNIFPRRVFVVESSKLTLPCFYDASPRGFSRWYSSSRADAVSNDAAERIHQTKVHIGGEETIAILEIENASKTDEGVYYCETANGVGEGRGAVHVHVVPKPHLVVRPPSLSSGMVGNGIYATPNKITCEVELACELPADCPEALFDWQFNERDLHNVITRESPLKPKYYEKELSDDWRSTRKSKRWIFSSSETSESSEGHPRKTHKHIRQVSELEISPSFSSANIGRFACNSIYGSASSELPEHEMLSAAPTQLKIIEVRKNHAKLSWKQPANQKRRGFGSNARMEGYLIEYRTETDRQWRPFPSGLFKTQDRIIGSYLLKDLEPNQKYQFRIRTRAVDGVMSVPSAHSDWVETPPSPPQDPVQKLQWRTIDDEHLLLEWDPVEMGHPSGSNLRYNVSWSDASQTVSTIGRNSMDNFVHSELVSQPNIVIAMAKTRVNGGNKKKKIRKNKDETEVADNCFTIAVGVQPLNDVGVGPASTDTVVHISTEGPKRIADNLLAIPVNATHLNLTWEWRNVGECENVIGAQISCIERRAFMREVSFFAVNNTLDSDYNAASVWKMSPERVTEVDSLTVNQSVPAYYTSWLVHSLKPGTDYSCTVQAFDQYGRYGNTSTHAASATTLDPAPPTAPEITRIKLQETTDGYTTLLEWTAVPLRNSLYNNITDRQRGYKILIYVSETAEKPITLVLTEAELQNPRKPSARIDGLKLMYFYTIKVAGFNEGGVGPVSEPTSIRLGMSSDLNGAAATVVSKFIILLTVIVAFWR